MTLREAIDAYTADCVRRDMTKQTLNGKRQSFKKLRKVIDPEVDLRAVTRADMRRFAESLSGKSGSRKSTLVHVRALLLWSVREELLEKSPMQGMAMPKDSPERTQPLSRDEVLALIRAAWRPADRALLMLMRWSGLAIGDAVALRPGDIRAGAITIKRRKTGSLCVIPLPASVLETLGELPLNERGYWFWTGKSEWVTGAKTWRDRLGRVAERAKVEAFHPHRLRDTFAVELLLDGTSIEDVAKLLGHSSVTITERYYAPWNRARLERLERVVRAAHGRDPVLAEVSA